MDIIGKILQALLGGERPRTWVDLAIVLIVCGTYAITQGMRFLHHQRHRQAVQAANPEQLKALSAPDGVKPPKATAALVGVILACAGISDFRTNQVDGQPSRAHILPMCFVRNTSPAAMCFVRNTWLQADHRKVL